MEGGDSLDKKQEIIEAMFEAFAEKGHSASLSDISNKVGIKPQSIYSHFENKDQIVWLALEREIESKLAFLERKLEKFTSENTETALKEVAFYIIEYFDDRAKLKFWRNIYLIRNQELRKRCKKKIRYLEKTIGAKMAAIFQKGASTGEIKSDNWEGMMYLYVAMIHGILNGMLLYDDGYVDMKDYAQKTWNAYWEGIKK